MWHVLLPTSPPPPPGSTVRPATVRPFPIIPAGQRHVPHVEAADPSAYCVEDLTRAPFRVQAAGAVASGYDTTFTFQVGPTCWGAGGARGSVGADLRCYHAAPVCATCSTCRGLACGSQCCATGGPAARHS